MLLKEFGSNKQAYATTIHEVDGFTNGVEYEVFSFNNPFIEVRNNNGAKVFKLQKDFDVVTMGNTCLDKEPSVEDLQVQLDGVVELANQLKEQILRKRLVECIDAFVSEDGDESFEDYEQDYNGDIARSIGAELLTIDNIYEKVEFHNESYRAETLREEAHIGEDVAKLMKDFGVDKDTATNIAKHYYLKGE